MGRDLSTWLYTEVVRPQLGNLPHSAALLGRGSEVLGFDTERSADHDWGPRLQLFLTPAGLAAHGDRLARLHAGVVVADLREWFTEHLGFDPEGEIGPLDWLGTPAQVFAEVTQGLVHHDGLGRLHCVREKLSWYPGDVWRYLLACQWRRIGQEAQFVGRCAEVGDELGSAVIAARLARDLMRLCLLLGRTYPPYPKWFGSAFAKLPCAGALGPVLRAAIAAGDGEERQRQLVIAYEMVGRLQNELQLAEPVDPRVRPFFDRPFLVPDSDGFAAALRAAVAGPQLRRLPLTGAVDQFADSTDLLSDRGHSRAVTAALIS